MILVVLQRRCRQLREAAAGICDLLEAELERSVGAGAAAGVGAVGGYALVGASPGLGAQTLVVAHSGGRTTAAVENAELVSSCGCARCAKYARTNSRV